jgi:hypothetical protein
MQYEILGKLPAIYLINLLVLCYRTHIGATFSWQKCTKNQPNLLALLQTI